MLAVMSSHDSRRHSAPTLENYPRFRRVRPSIIKWHICSETFLSFPSQSTFNFRIDAVHGVLEQHAVPAAAQAEAGHESAVRQGGQDRPGGHGVRVEEEFPVAAGRGVSIRKGQGNTNITQT